MRQRKARGSLEQRGKRWYLRIVQAKPLAPGSSEICRRRARIELGDVNEIRSKTAARRIADAWLSRNRPEVLQEGAAIAFADYCARFLEEHAELYRRGSRKRYRRIVNKHLVELGSVPMWTVGPAEIRALLARRRDTALKRSTLGGIRAVLLQILRQARADGFDAQAIDPKLVRLPKEDIAEKEQRFISAGELEQILAAVEFPLRAAYALMGLAGLRISEALGVAWQHLDLDSAPLLRVRQGAAGGDLLPLKTDTSRADLPLSAELAQILRDYRATWRPNDADLLFASRTGRPLLAENIRTRHWTPLLQRLGLPHAGFHAFRHGLPRRMFAAGCTPPVVMQLMRHASLKITERYMHTTAEDLRAAVNAASARHNLAHPRPTVTQQGNETQEIPA